MSLQYQSLGKKIPKNIKAFLVLSALFALSYSIAHAQAVTRVEIVPLNTSSSTQLTLYLPLTNEFSVYEAHDPDGIILHIPGISFSPYQIDAVRPSGQIQDLEVLGHDLVAINTLQGAHLRSLEWSGTEQTQLHLIFGNDLSVDTSTDLRIGPIQAGSRNWRSGTVDLQVDLGNPVQYQIAEAGNARDFAILFAGQFDTNPGQFILPAELERFLLSYHETTDQSYLHLTFKNPVDLTEAYLQTSPAVEFRARFLTRRDILGNPEDGRIAAYRPLIMIDPGHGGVDHGAIRAGISEKDIVLPFALMLRQALLDTGRYDVQMTREEDVFVPLSERVLRAQDAGADLFLSIHANTVLEGNPQGAALYTLSDEASDADAAAFAEHANDISGFTGVVDLQEIEFWERQSREIVFDLAQDLTNTRSEQLATALLSELDDHILLLPNRPHRQAGFRVLRQAEIPSLLLEMGFLSNAEDRSRLMQDAWRRSAITGLIEGIDRWWADQHPDQ